MLLVVVVAVVFVVGFCCWFLLLVFVVGFCCWFLLKVFVVGFCCWFLLLVVISIVVVCYRFLFVVISIVVLFLWISLIVGVLRWIKAWYFLFQIQFLAPVNYSKKLIIILIGGGVINLVVTGLFMFEIKHLDINRSMYEGFGVLLCNQIDTLSYLVTLNIVIHIDVRLIYLVIIYTGHTHAYTCTRMHTRTQTNACIQIKSF